MSVHEIALVVAGLVGGGFGKAAFDHYLAGRSATRSDDRERVAVVRQGAEQLRALDLAAYEDGKTWPLLEKDEWRTVERAANELGSRRLMYSWDRYQRDAQELARLISRGTPPVAEEFSARRRSERSYGRLMRMLRRIEQR